MAKFIAFLIVAPLAALWLVLSQLPGLFMKSYTAALLWLWLLVPAGYPLIGWQIFLFAVLIWETFSFKMPKMPADMEKADKPAGFTAEVIGTFVICVLALGLGYLLSLYFY